ncbi:MAG: recombinase family protein, partial [Clostridia bacterium]|nr:recombinase family protein [Clostridia bacterium]
IEGQLRVCQQYAAANGIAILETYIDEATTGTNDQRPAFQKMLADSAKPVAWSIVLVYAIDSFGRTSIEIAVNKQKLKKNNKTLISATQRTSDNLDGSQNLDGILLENVYIGIAEYYSAELSQKVSRGMYENRRKGYFCGGLVPYGYRVENKRLLVDENQAEVVKYIFEQYASGRIAKDIIDELTAKGILLRGKPFPIYTFYHLLRAEKYIGIYRHRDEVYKNFYPPIVPNPSSTKCKL